MSLMWSSEALEGAARNAFHWGQAAMRRQGPRAGRAEVGSTKQGGLNSAVHRPWGRPPGVQLRHLVTNKG